jgi:3,4-dihydroxy 2-butanone 4-phosphate synthase/GTP cyclohydrolase II
VARKLTETRIPTIGTFALHLYRNGSNEDHVAFVMGSGSERDDVLARVHSECFTGEILGSLRCGPGLSRLPFDLPWHFTVMR